MEIKFLYLHKRFTFKLSSDINLTVFYSNVSATQILQSWNNKSFEFTFFSSELITFMYFFYHSFKCLFLSKYMQKINRRRKAFKGQTNRLLLSSPEPFSHQSSGTRLKSSMSKSTVETKWKSFCVYFNQFFF